MQKRTLTLALAAGVAITAGRGLGLFELTIAGLGAAVVAIALWLKDTRPATNRAGSGGQDAVGGRLALSSPSERSGG
jgi:hypothetical protein